MINDDYVILEYRKSDLETFSLEERTIASVSEDGSLAITSQYKYPEDRNWSTYHDEGTYLDPQAVKVLRDFLSLC